jgi:hypothetical protein
MGTFGPTATSPRDIPMITKDLPTESGIKSFVIMVGDRNVSI